MALYRSKDFPEITCKIDSSAQHYQDEKGRLWLLIDVGFDEKSALSSQVGGSHYKNFAIQPVEFIHRNGLNFMVGNVIKYCCRYENKNGVEDLKKARHYLDMLIEMEEKK